MSIVAVPVRAIICSKNWVPVAGVFGAVIGFGIVRRKVRIIVISTVVCDVSGSRKPGYPTAIDTNGRLLSAADLPGIVKESNSKKKRKRTAQCCTCV